MHLNILPQLKSEKSLRVDQVCMRIVDHTYQSLIVDGVLVRRGHRPFIVLHSSENDALMINALVLNMPFFRIHVVHSLPTLLAILSYPDFAGGGGFCEGTAWTR